MSEQGTLGVEVKTLQLKGNIVYEYNPLHNYRIDKKAKMSTEDCYIEYDINNSLDDSVILEPYSLVDFDTEELNFDLEHPVQINALYSYDGTVNLVLNDDKNIPRLINTRFSSKGNNTYEIIDRKGNADANIYDRGEQFELDTSLVKKITKIPEIEFVGCNFGGSLPVGNYHFYFKYTDGDGNDTDFVGESGLVSVFIGSSPIDINTGIGSQNSNKTARFILKNIDSSYSYVKVYYTKSTSDYNQNSVTTAYVINKKFIVNNLLYCNILITGNEEVLEISIAEINSQYEVYSRAKTQAICLNRLFLGNLHKIDIDYQELFDLSLRIYPFYTTKEYKSVTDECYTMEFDKKGYYSEKNIYNETGYWPGEFYRFGIVYILEDGSLSPVFNVRGTSNLPTGYDLNSSYRTFDLYNENKRVYIAYSEESYLVEGGVALYENVKGVVRFPNSSDNENIFGITFKFQDEVIKKLKEDLKVRGYFFVRLKRLPTILCLALTIPIDNESHTPMILFNDKVYSERFLTDGRILSQNYIQRLYEGDKNNIITGAICPDYDLNYPFFNLIFTGDDFVCDSLYNGTLNRSSINDRHYYFIKNNNTNIKYKTKIIAVEDSVPLVGIDDYTFSARAGNAEDINFKYISKETKTTDTSNLLRGAFGPYLGLVGRLNPNEIINIHIPAFNEGLINQYMEIRCKDESPFYAISDRLNINNERDINTFYRGDCYICLFTHRVNRNFNDSEAPSNSDIVDELTWKSYYDVNDSEKTALINRGDINAILLGQWITFKLRSTRNLNIRTIDTSNVYEYDLMGHPRSFYPHTTMNVDGSYKMKEALCYNDGFERSVSSRWNILCPDVPYILNTFINRIAYSDISVSDSFKNGFRIFRTGHSKDYNMEHGAITKLLEKDNNLICVFEHGVAVIPINERTAVNDQSQVFINTPVVLPENPIMLSDSFGSQWIESVIATDVYIYGVDTVAKKIWRTNGKNFEIISDFSILQFLNNNITLSERDKTPIIGIRNVKTHYNAFKHDVMFTFYDDLMNIDENVWNICWNELQGKWITFYSWVPSYSANIDNMFFSFNRETSRDMAKLCISHKGSGTGIVLDNNIFNQTQEQPVEPEPIEPEPTNDPNETQQESPRGVRSAPVNLLSTILSLANINLPNNIDFSISYELLKDPWGNNTQFEVNNNNLTFIGTNIETKDIWLLNLKATLTINSTLENTTPGIKSYLKSWNSYIQYTGGIYYSTVAITSKNVIENRNKLTTDFWKHGQSGIIDIKDKIYPCKWYGLNHPFEFEFVVAENPLTLKIFENLKIISNKVAPESFHYEIVGEGYDFSKDKLNMFYRQEATKEIYLSAGSNISFDKRYKKLTPSKNVKSTIFPTYYRRDNLLNQIYDCYKELIEATQAISYDRMSGSEIIYDELLNEFRILLHQKGIDIVKEKRIRGNMHYKEDLWDILINPIVFKLKNETNWVVPPINTIDFKDDTLSSSNCAIPLIYSDNYQGNSFISNSGWTERKETKLRDKYIKIKVRYYNDGLPLDLVVIQALKTLYTISFA